MTDQSWKKMPKIDHFVIAPTLKCIVCTLEWLQYEIDSITSKAIFRRWKSFGHFAEKNDGYDGIFEKKIKIFQNLSSDCRIHIWQFFVHFSSKFFLLHSCFEFEPFLWVEILKFSGKTIIIWPKTEKKKFRNSNC